MKHNLLTTTTIAMLLASGAYAQETIKIGVLTPLSGTYAGIGQQVRWGIDQSVEEINADGGIAGRQIELVYEDSEGKSRSCRHQGREAVHGRQR